MGMCVLSVTSGKNTSTSYNTIKDCRPAQLGPPYATLLFSDGERHIATSDDVGLFHDLNGKTLVRSIWCFHLRQYHFSKSSFTQNSNWVNTVYRKFQLTSSSTCLCTETQSFNVLLRHRIMYRIHRCYTYNTVICCWCWWWWWRWWQK